MRGSSCFRIEAARTTIAAHFYDPDQRGRIARAASGQAVTVSKPQVVRTPLRQSRPSQLDSPSRRRRAAGVERVRRFVGPRRQGQLRGTGCIRVQRHRGEEGKRTRRRRPPQSRPITKRRTFHECRVQQRGSSRGKAGGGRSGHSPVGAQPGAGAPSRGRDADAARRK